MVGKRVQFDDETWEAIQAVMRNDGSSFQELADEAVRGPAQEAQAAGRVKGIVEGECRAAPAAPSASWAAAGVK